MLVGNIDALKIRDHNFTCAAWFQPSGTTTKSIVLSQGNPENLNGNGYALLYRPDLGPKKVQFHVHEGTNASGQVIEFSVAAGLEDGWHHLAGIVENFGGGDLVLYLDGVEVARAANTQVGDVTGTIPFQLGTLHNGGNWFPGLLADVRVWQRALSGDEIAAVASLPPYGQTIEQVRQHNNLNEITQLQTGQETTTLSYDRCVDFCDTAPRSSSRGVGRNPTRFNRRGFRRDGGVIAGRTSH